VQKHFNYPVQERRKEMQLGRKATDEESRLSEIACTFDFSQIFCPQEQLLETTD
jgi:hypothetical protein